MLELFPKSGPEKLAAHKLSDDPTGWPEAVIDQVLRKNPFLGEYKLDFVEAQSDPQKGYLLGSVLVTTNDVEYGTEKGTGEVTHTPPDRAIAIPVVVSEGKLSPPKVLSLGGKFYPLTDNRLRDTLFAPAVEAGKTGEPDTESVRGIFTPPPRNTGAYTASTLGVEKSSSLLDRVLTTLTPRVKEAFLDRIRTERELLYAVATNQAFANAVHKVAEAKAETSGDFTERLLSSVPPDVVQLYRHRHGYLAKLGNARLYRDEKTFLTEAEAERAFPAEVVKLARDGVVTIDLRTKKAQYQPSPDIQKPSEVVKEFGSYVVKRDDGTEVSGIVFPEVYDFDLSPRLMALFSNGELHACQATIAGRRDPDYRWEDHVPQVVPQGDGTFILERDGKPCATLPLTIRNRVISKGEVAYHASAMDGFPLTLVVTPGLKTVTKLNEQMYAIPEKAQFLPLGKNVKIASRPDAFDKLSKVSSIRYAVQVKKSGDEYFLDGLGIEKVASGPQSREDAEFFLVLAGVAQPIVREKLAGRYTRPITFYGSIEVRSFDEILGECRAKTAAFLKTLPEIRQDLTKAAAGLTDDLSVENTLSVGFVTPSNLAAFIEAIPDLDESASKLAELYLMHQVGLKGIDAPSVEQAMLGLDKTISTLKGIALGTEEMVAS